jgi:hypothetical protein
MKLDNTLTYCLPDSQVTFHSYDASESTAHLFIVKDAVLERGYAIFQKISFVSLPTTFEIAGIEAEFVINTEWEKYPTQLPNQDSFEDTDILFTLHTPEEDKFYIVAHILNYIINGSS